MDKRRIIPIIIAVVLVIFGIMIFINNKDNSKTYSKLIARHNKKEEEYTKIEAGNVINIGGIDMQIVSSGGQELIMIANSDITIDDNITNEIDINISKSKKICISQDNCYTLKLK